MTFSLAKPIYHQGVQVLNLNQRLNAPQQKCVGENTIYYPSSEPFPLGVTIDSHTPLGAYVHALA